MKSCRIARKSEGALEDGGHKLKVRPVNMVVFFTGCIHLAALVKTQSRQRIFLIRG